MAVKRPLPNKKRRVRAHVIADLSANYVERFALLQGFTVEFITKDYGYDLNIYTFNSRGEFELGTIFIQLKATERLAHSKDGKSINFSIKKTDLNTWFYEPYPVILIVYDAKNSKAYWVYVQQHLRKKNVNFNLKKVRKNYTISIPKRNILNDKTFLTFRSFKSSTIKELNNVITYK